MEGPMTRSESLNARGSFPVQTLTPGDYRFR
jgi:hypothetical protein